MQFTEAQIWSYIDGQLSEEERLRFDQALAADEAFKSQYDKILKLHQSLLTIPVESAPATLHAEIMTKVSTAKIGVQNTFGGLKYFLWGLGALIGTLITIIILNGDANIGTPSSDYLTDLSAWSDYFTGLLADHSFNPNMIYIFVISMLIVIYSFDEVLRKQHLIRPLSDKS